MSTDRGARTLPDAPPSTWFAAVDAAPVGFAALDLEGRFVHVNGAFADLVHARPDDLVRRGAVDLVHPASATTVVRLVERLRLGLVDHACERIRLALPDGTTSRAHVEASALPGPDGRPALVVSWWRDATGDLALQAATEQLGVIAASCPLALYLVDLDGVVLAWNRAAERIFGWTEDEAVGSRLPIVPPGQHHVYERRRWQVADGRSFAGMETTRMRRDGTSVDVSISAAPVHGPDGDVVAVLGIAEDVTARVAAARAAATTELRAAAILANTQDTVSLMDADGTILQVSRGSSEILGYPASFWQDRSLFDVAHPDDAPLAAEQLRRVLASPGAVHRGTYRGRHADGRWTWVELVAVNRLDDPDVGAIVLTSRNVDEQVRAERLQRCQSLTLELIARRASLPDTLLAVEALVHELVPDGRSLVLLDDDPGGLDPGDAAAAGAWCVPVVSESTGAVLGAIATTLEDGRQPTEHDVEVLAVAARLAAIAVEQADAARRLTHQATHDGLTGLPNRTLLVDRLEHALDRSSRTGRGVALLFCDLDRFKLVNDSHGHGAGDRILFEVATRLRAVLRPGDTVARFGGDEFVLLCEDVDGPDHAARIAERVRAVLAEPFVIDTDDVVLTVSIGIALAAKPATPADTLLRDADAAMNRAKELGRDRHELFDEDARARVHDALRLEGDLRRAIEGGDLAVAYQPLVDLATGRVAGAEALVRWFHPERGLLGPEAFIPLAEQTGLVVPLGWWVLDRALRDASRWSTRDGRPLTLSVNLSGRQLLAPDSAAVVAAALRRHRFPAAQLSLELTETVLVDAPEAAAALARLKELGVAVAIDDFGTGYSSLSYLHRLPVDVVKVDRAFVDGVDGDMAGSAIATAIVQVCGALGLESSAEGVERPEQLARLRELGVTSAQGWLFGRPVDAETFELILHADPVW